MRVTGRDPQEDQVPAAGLEKYSNQRGGELFKFECCDKSCPC